MELLVHELQVKYLLQQVNLKQEERTLQWRALLEVSHTRIRRHWASSFIPASLLAVSHFSKAVDHNSMKLIGPQSRDAVLTPPKRITSSLWLCLKVVFINVMNRICDKGQRRWSPALIGIEPDLLLAMWNNLWHQSYMDKSRSFPNSNCAFSDYLLQADGFRQKEKAQHFMPFLNDHECCWQCKQEKALKSTSGYWSFR